MKTEVFTTASALPPLIEGSLLHSEWMFRNVEQNTDAQPLMIVAYDNDKELGHLLVAKYRELRLIPPGMHMWYSIHGEGVYADSCIDREQVFSAMLEKLFTLFDFRHTFIELRGISDSRFAYSTLSGKEFFPRRDSRIYISLHSRDPWQRLTRTYRSHIRKAEQRGVTYSLVTDAAEIEASLTLLRRYYASKVGRHLPPAKFLRSMLGTEDEEPARARLFAVRYKGEIIGCSLCLYHDGNAYLAYSCGQRKSHPLLYPGIVAVWAAIKDAKERTLAHFEFLETGNPKIPSGYLNFILNFGGKQVGTLQWCHFKWNWINKILRAIYV